MGLFTKTKGNGWNFDKNTETLYIDGRLDNVSRYFQKFAIKVRRVVCRKGAVLTDGTDLFLDMSHLETADLSALDVSGCTSFRSMFDGCTSLKVLDLSSWDIRNARNMERMFFLCSSLEKIITGPQWIPHKVTDTDSMFADCESLETIEQAMLDLPSITYCSYMFQDCGSLRTLDLRGMDVRNAGYMRSIFSGCKNLRELDLSGWQIPHQCNTEELFEGLPTAVRIYADDDSVIRLVPDGIQARSHEPEQKQCPVKDKETQAVKEPEQNDRIIQGSGWSFDPDTGALTLSGIIEKVPDAFESFAEQVLSVKALKGSVLVKGRKLFNQMKNLASADLTALDVSQCTDFSGMFGGCHALKVLDLSSWDFTNASTANHMFSGCIGLEEIITGPKWIPRNLSTTGFMFCGCRKLKSIDFSAWTEAPLTDTVGMFASCESLRELDLSMINTAKITEMNLMFDGCTDLQSLDLDGWDVSAVKDMSAVFRKCGSMTELDLSGWDVSAVTDMSWMFADCTGLQFLNLDGWDVSAVTDMSKMFSNCTELQELNLAGWDVSGVTDMSWMFSRCKKLKTLDLRGWRITEGTDTYDMFKPMSRSIRILADDESIVKVLPDHLKDKAVFPSAETAEKKKPSAKKQKKETEPAPPVQKEKDFDEEDAERPVKPAPKPIEPKPEPKPVETKPAPAVQKDKDFDEEDAERPVKPVPKPKENTVKDKETQSLHAQEQNDRIIQGSGWSFDPDTGALTFSGIIEKVPDAFGSFAEQVLTVKALKGAALINGRNMFKGMKNLALADLRELDVSQCTDFTYMFGSCNALKVLDLSSWDFTNAATANHMFSGCTALEEIITGPKWIPRNLSTAVFMFSGCRKLQELDFSAWAEAPLENTCGMFYGCTSLRELDLSMIHTAKIKNIGNMFNGCTDLQSLHLDGWDVSAAGKMDAMFKECGSLTELNLSGWDVSGVSDMTWMFGGCEKLKTLDLRGWRIDKRTDTENMFRSLPKTVHICADDKSVVNSLPDYLKVKAVQVEIQTSEKERTAPSVKETEPAHAVPENIETGLPEDAYSLYLRAIGYCNGTEGLPQDLNQALQTVLAAKEHAEGQLLNNIRYLIAQIGWMHTYDREDESEDMIGQRRDAAKNGDTNALLDLANRLYFGSEYVDKDPEEALICAVQIKYSRFSENKLYAENLLEVLRENSLYDTLAAGLEAEKSGYLAEAFKQYEKAALQGSAAGMWYLSRMYRDGKGTAANLKKSDAFKELAASLGWGEALFTDAKDSFNTYIKGGSAEEARDKIRKAEAYGHRLSKNQNHELGKMEVRVLQVLGY